MRFGDGLGLECGDGREHGDAESGDRVRQWVLEERHDDGDIFDARARVIAPGHDLDSAATCSLNRRAALRRASTTSHRHAEDTPRLLQRDGLLPLEPHEHVLAGKHAVQLLDVRERRGAVDARRIDDLAEHRGVVLRDVRERAEMAPAARALAVDGLEWAAAAARAEVPRHLRARAREERGQAPEDVGLERVGEERGADRLNGRE
jgi:hypothetical protein